MVKNETMKHFRPYLLNRVQFMDHLQIYERIIKRYIKNDLIKTSIFSQRSVSKGYSGVRWTL